MSWKKFKVPTVLYLGYKKRNNHKIFHSSAKLTDSYSDTDEAFISTHQNIMAKIKNYVCKDWIVLYVITSHRIKIFEC